MTFRLVCFGPAGGWKIRSASSVFMGSLRCVNRGSTAGWALPCRFTLRDLAQGQLLPAANFIMHPGRGLNNSAGPQVKGCT